MRFDEDFHDMTNSLDVVDKKKLKLNQKIFKGGVYERIIKRRIQRTTSTAILFNLGSLKGESQLIDKALEYYNIHKN